MEGASYVAVTETNELRGKKAVKLGVADEWFNALEEKTVRHLALYLMAQYHPQMA